MSRTIKFRVWDKGTKRMFNPGDFTLESDGGKVLGFNIRLSGKHSENENDFEVLQYTGLKDKNGKEIYEGDQIRGNTLRYVTRNYNGSNPQGLNFQGTVNYHIGGFCVHFTDQSVRNRFGGKTHIYLNDHDAMTVIGNIHENPDLLK